MIKRCSKCNCDKDLLEFSKSKYKSGYASRCIACTNIYHKIYYQNNKDKLAKRSRDRYAINPEKNKSFSKNWIKNNPDKVKERHLKRYGINLIQYKTMIINQNYSCKICKTSQSELNQDLCVDHCHRTYKVRGLLCVACNMILGLLKDRLDVTCSIKEYLIENQVV
jgi:hypothetical protein